MNYRYREEVIKAKAGCRDSTEKLIEKLTPLIYSAIGRYRRDWDREDLYQEACLILIKTLKDFDESLRVPFLAFARSRIYYGIHNLTRGQVHEISLNADPYNNGATLLEGLIDPSEGIEKSTIRKEEEDRLKEAIENLTPKQRDIIVAHYFEGKKFKDIAIEQGKHYKAILGLKDRALKELRKMMILE